MIKKSTFYAPCLSRSAIHFSVKANQLRPFQTKTNARHFSNRPWQVQNRRQNWGSNNPLFNGDNLLYSIIGLNVIVFGAWKYSENDRKTRRFLQDNFTISSNGVMREFRIHTFLTSIFSHRDPWHLLSNSVAFYFFGQTCLSYLGGSRFLVLYIGGGLVTSFAQVLGPHIIPRDFPSRFKVSKYSSAAGENRRGQLNIFQYARYLTLISMSLGASSAVAAVVAWNILSFPRSTVMLFFVLPVPAAFIGME
jgi:membrane associated rhomboid family serine protease